MASVFRIQKSNRYVVEYTDADGRRRRVHSGTANRRDAQRVAEKLDRQVFDIRHGLATPHSVVVEERMKKPLWEVTKAFERHLVGKGDSPSHVRQVIRRLKRLTRFCEFRILADLALVTNPNHPPIEEVVLEFLDGRHGRRGKPFATSTRNACLRELQHFCRWAIRTERLAHSPILKITKRRDDGRLTRERRALTDEEILRLISTTNRSHLRGRMDGKSRSMLYRVAIETGLRRGELASLKPRDFILDGEFPHVVVRAAYTKNRKLVKQPLTFDLADAVHRFLKRRPVRRPVWPIPKHAALMLRRDLEEAGIPYIDDQGRFADFHALRHTFITRMALAGVPVAHAQKLARHSNPQLTLKHYTHIEEAHLRDQLNRLPSLSGGPSRPSN